jgi:hypothetical protein
VINWHVLTKYGDERRLGANILIDIQSWLFALLLYPGLFFSVALALGIEWLLGAIRPRLSPSLYRTAVGQAHLLQPLFSFFRLAGRRGPAGLTPQVNSPGKPGYEAVGYIALAGAAAPVLALALMPLGGNPAAHSGALQADVLVVPVLLALQPLSMALSRLFSSPSPLEGTRPLGRLLVGLAPALIVVAALVHVAGGDSLDLAGLGTAPETGWQFLVRLLAGLALLVSLPWWLGPSAGYDSAGSLIGRHLQTIALGAFWTALILPRPGDAGWAIVVSVVGTIAASFAIRLVPVIWMPLRPERDSARLVWTSALPLAALALLISLWTTA